MNPTGKLDLDTLLGSWPAPTRDERAWEEQADAIVKAALAAAETSGSAALNVTPALFEAPPLAAEQGEPQAPIASAGEKKMSQESDPSAPKSETIPQSAVPSTVASVRPSERKRGSLKEIAARASQSGAASRPAPASSAPGPGASQSKSSATSSPLPVITSSSPARPAEASKDDSGIVNLNTINAAATAEQKAAAEKAKPASEGLFEDDAKEKGKDKPAAAVAAVVPISAAKASAEKKKGSSGVVVGGIIAIIGLAAAFAITKVNKPEAPPPAPVAAEVKPASTDVKTESAAQPSPSAAPVAEATAEPSTSSEPAQDTGKVAAAPQGGAGAGAPVASAPAAPDPGGEKTAEAEQPASTAAAATTPKPAGDLKGAMAQAVGGDGSSKVAPTAENAEPASGARNQNIPEQPSQGSVQAAIGTVMGGAKACVAGADDVSRAQITFSSSGSVSNVSVTGWAASHGATGCIKAALKGAKVGPFSKSTFSVGVTIRP